MAVRESALELLAQGIPASQVAGTLGVSESYVSQLLGDEDFGSQLQATRTEAAQADLDYDKKIDTAESLYLQRIEDKAGFANLQQSLQAFRILNSAKRRKDSRVQAPGINIGQIINITLPVASIPDYKINNQSEIVEVEGKTMLSATPKRLEEIMAARNGERPAVLQLPGVTKVERAASVLQKLENKIERKPIKTIPNLVDFL